MRRTLLGIVGLAFCLRASAGAQQWGPSYRAKDLRLDASVQLLSVSKVGDFAILYQCRTDSAGIIEMMFRYDIDNDLYYLFRVDTRSGGLLPAFGCRTGAPVYEEA